MQENILHPFHISACVSECVCGGGGGHESYLAQYKHTGIVFSIPKKLPQATYEHRYSVASVEHLYACRNDPAYWSWDSSCRCILIIALLQVLS